MSTVPNATIVATSFVKQYYSLLAQKPDQLYKFYKSQSVYSFCQQGGGPDSTVMAIGQEDINSKIMTTLRPFNGHSCKAEIVGIDSQESRQGGVLVLVTGYLVIVGTPAMQHFTQSFFLDKQTQPYEGYFVLNDILRYLPPVVTNVGTQGPMMTPESYMRQQGQAGAAQPATQDVNDDEADERVAEVSLDIEDEEEEEERPGDEEADAGAEAEEAEAEAAEEAEEEARDDAEEAGGEEPAEAPAGRREANKQPGRWAQEAQEAADAAEGDAALAGYLAEEAQAPRTWASMAGRLQQEGGQLRPKAPAWGTPSAPRALPVLPAPTTTITGFPAPGTKGAGKSSGSSSRPVATTTPATSAATTRTPAQSGNVWLWVSRLPTDPAAETQEVLDGLNAFLVELGCEGRASEVDRRDPEQEWASIAVTSQEAADSLIVLSKDRTLLLRGKPLKAELHRMAYSGPRRPGRGGGGEGRGAARGGATVGGAGREDDRHDGGKGESRGGGRQRRKPRGEGGEERYAGGDSAPSGGEKGEKGKKGSKGSGKGGHK